jgi:very-short-patch-repair endonuclease
MSRPTRGEASAVIVHQARSLRHEATSAEKVLWSALRGRQMAGLKFRRQHPIGQVILDFYCVEKRLAVEVDGAIHLNPEQAAHDADRTDYLAQHGIRVLRFTNDEVERHLPDVLKKIQAACLTPQPPLLIRKSIESEEGA